MHYEEEMNEPDFWDRNGKVIDRKYSDCGESKKYDPVMKSFECDCLSVPKDTIKGA